MLGTVTKRHGVFWNHLDLPPQIHNMVVNLRCPRRPDPGSVAVDVDERTPSIW